MNSNRLTLLPQNPRFMKCHSSCKIPETVFNSDIAKAFKVTKYHEPVFN